MIVWSYGGGVQTAAIAVLIGRGQVPTPDLTVMADTGREASETWEYLHHVMQPYLTHHGVTVEIVPHTVATVDLYGGEDGNSLLIPAYTQTGRLEGFCSNEWKRRPVRRYLRQRGVTDCTMWLGFSTDELRRMHQSDVGWIHNEFPLIEQRLSRVQCVRLVESEGLGTPPRSSCWMCPHRQREEWRRLRDGSPADWEQACTLDDQVRARDTQGGVYVSNQRVPLREMNLDPLPEPQLELFACESGYCWT